MNHEAAACLEVALRHLGRDVTIKPGGLIVERTLHGRDPFTDALAALKALPLAHSLHLAMMGREDPIFRELFKRAAKRAEVEEAEALFDVCHVEKLLPLAVDRLKRRVIEFSVDMPQLQTKIEGII